MRLPVFDVDLEEQFVDLLLEVSTVILQVLQIVRIGLPELLIIRLDPLA